MAAVVRWRRVATVLTAIAALGLTACSDGHTDVRAVASPGWSSYGGNAANSNYVYPTVPDDLTLSWTRPTGGPITAPLTLSNQSNVGVTATTDSGCNVFVLSPINGRKNFCKRMREGTATNALLVDQFDQPYLGEQTMFLAFNAGGAIRWRMPVIGIPQSAKFAGPGLVLVTTTQGQLLLLDAQTSEFAAPEVRLRADARPDDGMFGYGDCVTGGSDCAIPAPAAVDTDAQRFFVNYWPENADRSRVEAFDYGAVSGARQIRSAWSAEVPGGVVGPPTLSADGTTVYAFSRPGELVALDASSGQVKWSHDLGDHGFATMTVSPDGLIIPTGSVGAPLTLLRDRGDSAEQVWQRKDLAVVSLSALTSSDTAWTVVRDAGRDSLSLMEVNTSDGATTRTLGLPGSKGFATGISVGVAGQIATATNIGEVYFFDSAASIESR